jgi:hypothetical protein
MIESSESVEKRRPSAAQKEMYVTEIPQKIINLKISVIVGAIPIIIIPIPTTEAIGIARNIEIIKNAAKNLPLIMESL